MYSRHVYGSNIPLKYTVMLCYQQLYLRNKVSIFRACLFSKIFEPCLFSNGRLLSREYGMIYFPRKCLKFSIYPRKFPHKDGLFCIHQLLHSTIFYLIFYQRLTLFQCKKCAHYRVVKDKS